jgi:hypothetical protein
MSRFGLGKRVVVDIKKNNLLTGFAIIKTI